ncbi:MAG: hypothetical protein ACYDB1_00680 [Acidiferrobacteraceae bacterium]
MPQVTLNLSEGTLDAANKLCTTLGCKSLEELFDQMLEDQLWKLESSQPGEILAGEIEGALDSVLEPMVSLSELVIQPTQDQDAVLIESIPETFRKLQEISPRDLVLAEFADQGELAQRACCIVYAKLDDALWGTSTARRLVTSALSILKSVGGIDKTPSAGGQ